MRPIKFRAWSKKMIQMKQVERIFFNENTIQISHGFTGEDKSIWFLDHCELMQFTGIQDLKGTDIYEGDIIKTYRGQHLYVKWDYDQWGLFDGICNEASIDPENDEIIGNVFEHPELFEVQS